MDLENETPSDLINQFKKGIFPADGLVLIFSLFLMIVGILNYTRLGQPSTWISTDCGVIVILLMLIYRENRDPRRSYYWLHFLWPILSMAFIYSQCAAWDNLIFRRTFDPLLIKWDSGIFGTDLNRIIAPAVNSLWVDELMHAFYSSYYLILFLPAAVMLWQRKPQAFEMVFSLVLMLYIHFLFFMIFPSDGPIPERGILFDRGVIFIPLMNLIYSVSEQSGGGAFPSTHVSASVLIFLYTVKYAPRLRIPVGIACTGVVLATVYCSYHYAIDSAAGIVTGTLFFFIGQYIYARGRHPSETPALAIQHNV